MPSCFHNAPPVMISLVKWPFAFRFGANWSTTITFPFGAITFNVIELALLVMPLILIVLDPAIEFASLITSVFLTVGVGSTNPFSKVDWLTFVSEVIPFMTSTRSDILYNELPCGLCSAFIV